MKITKTEAAESAPRLFSFYKSTKFCCYYECIQIKVDPLQIRLMYCSYLYDQKWSNLSSFRVYQKKNATKCADVTDKQTQTGSTDFGTKR